MIIQYEPRIKTKYIKKVSDQIKSGWIGPGDTVKEFENKLKDITGSKYVNTTNSGTSALLAAIHSLNLKPGSTILFPAYTMVAGAHAAKALGFNVKLVDIKKETLSMNPDLIQITDDVSAVIFVNHNGYCGKDRYTVKSICESHGIKMIEDSAQGLFIEDGLNRHTGTVGDVGILSFSVPKVVTTGQGGAVITNDESIAQKSLGFIDQGGNDWRKTKIHTDLGINLKTCDILAAYGLAQLEDAEDIIKKRRNIIKTYKKHKIDIVDFDQKDVWMVASFFEDSDRLVNRLKSYNVQACKLYKPVYMHDHLGCDDNYPVALEVSNDLVYLPSSLNLTKYQIECICDKIKGVSDV